MPQSYRGYPHRAGEEHWLQQTRPQNATGKIGSIFRYFFRKSNYAGLTGIKIFMET